MSRRRNGKLIPGIILAIFLAVLLGGVALTSGTAWAQLASLKTVPPPEPLNLDNFIKNRAAAIQLGKALFWDMQVGSDGVQSCATCHFHAGADSRNKNQLNPDVLGGDTIFGNNLLGLPAPPAGTFGPNATLTLAKFPFHNLTDKDLVGEPLQNPGNVISDVNDVCSSQGVQLRQFVDIVPGNPVDASAPLADPVFQLGGVNIRRVEPRNTPSMINAVYHFANFWDGRANNIFNGNNPFGPADPRSHVFANVSGSLAAQSLRLRQSALASQAVGPPLSDFEMSWQGRSWPKVGKKMLTLKPLAQQIVHPSDSVLGPLVDTVTGTGLTPTYTAMIRQAFPNKYWNITAEHLEFIDPLNPGQGLQIVPGPANPADTGQFTQMEANFSFFFGLAVQLYEATLVANDSPLDRFLEGAGAQTVQEARGMNTFLGAGGCAACHSLAELTDVAVRQVQGVNLNGVPVPFSRNPLNADENMALLTGRGLYDNGWHNNGVRPGGSTDPASPAFLAVNEDQGRGGTTGLGAPLTNFPLAFSELGLRKIGFLGPPLPAFLATFVPNLPLGFQPSDTLPDPGRLATFGTFKTPALRNVELTGPYMHNGGHATLRQVVDFYTRGGDFPVTNNMDFDPGVFPIGKLDASPTRKNEVVAFMLSMTDARVKNETAPFDHPELFIPIDGRAPVSTGSRAGFVTNARFQRIPPVGLNGLPAEGLPALTPFLNANPFRP
jgi:cytochrome c peroxidase